jgi:polygalacturonase
MAAPVLFTLFFAGSLCLGQATPITPALPTIGSTVYNVGVSNSAIDGGAVAVGDGTTDNTSVINAFISYAASHGGGTVEIPAASSPYMSNEILMQSGINFQVDKGATVRNITNSKTLMGSSGPISNIELSGGGAFDDAATSSLGTKMINFVNSNNILVNNVTIENSTGRHLYLNNCNNVTINQLSIHDQNVAAGEDGVDYSGSNYLLENSSIADGDDGFVNKAGSFPTKNVTVINDTFGSGGGIGWGTGTAAGGSNYYIDNVTFNGSESAFTFKGTNVSGSAGGGGLTTPISGVVFKNITMKNVVCPIYIDSFWGEGTGGSNFPSSPTDSTHYPSTIQPITPYAPVLEDVLFLNITSTAGNQDNAGRIFGLFSTPDSLQNITFDNVNIQAGSDMEFWYASGIDYSGLTVTIPSSAGHSHDSPVPGVYMYDVTGPVPEPATLALAGISALLLAARRPRRVWS